MVNRIRTGTDGHARIDELYLRQVLISNAVCVGGLGERLTIPYIADLDPFPSNEYITAGVAK